MNILVTGGDGFIGSHLIKQLEENGHSGTNIASDVQGITDAEFGSPQVIYHLGAYPRVGYSIRHPGKVLSNNYEATLRVLEYCRTHPKTRLINISSSSVKFSNLTENPYALSKQFGEDLVALYINTFGVIATNVRLFNVYGPGESDYGEFTTLIKACKKRVMSGQSLRVNGDGAIKRDYTHVLDVVNGLIAVDRELQKADAKFIYDLGNANPISTLEIVEAFRAGTNLKVVHGPGRVGDAPLTCADVDKRPAGWIPVFDVLDYIQDWKIAGCPND